MSPRSAPLFERSARGAYLTPVGRVFFDDSRGALAQFDNAYAQARLAATGALGSLTIGVNELAMRHPTVLAAIAEFIRRHPAVQLRALTLHSVEQLRALRLRQIDAGFVIERSAAMKELAHLPIARDDFVLALPAAHPLAARRTVAIEDLVEQAFVTVSAERHWLSQSKLLARCHASGFTPRSVAQVDSERLQVALVGQGLGLAIINASARFALPEGVELRPIRNFRVALDLDLVWLRQNEGGLMAAFRDIVGECLPNPAPARLEKPPPSR